MNTEDALIVRNIRVGPTGFPTDEINATWREVAGLCAEEFDGNWGNNQLAGMELCEYGG